MSWRDQLKVELLNNTCDDLMITNVTTITKEVWKDSLPASDDTLHWLVRNNITEPFNHVSVVIKFPEDNLPFDMSNMTPIDMEGVYWNMRPSNTYVRASYLTWIKLLKRKVLSAIYEDDITTILSEMFPESIKLFDITPKKSSGGSCERVIPTSGVGLQTFSVRCTAPISLAYELRKYQTELYWYEVPVIYSSKEVGFFKQELRNTLGIVKEDSDWVSECMASDAFTAYQTRIEADTAGECVHSYATLNKLVTWIWTGSSLGFTHMIEECKKHEPTKEMEEFLSKLSSVVES